MGYRSIPTTTTKVTPSELFLGRTMRTRIDLIKPKRTTYHPLTEQMKEYKQKMQREGQKGRQQPRELFQNDQVLVRNFQHPSKWISGKVVEKVADRTYRVNVNDRIVKRHIDHIVKSPTQLERMDDREIEYPEIPRNTDPAASDDSIEEPHRYPHRARNPVRRYGIDDYVYQQ